MAPTYVLAYNPSDIPVVVDANGHTIGGHEWAAARRSQLLDDHGNGGRVIVVTHIDEEGASPEALKAWHQAGEWNRASEKWADVPLDTVRDVARHQVNAGTILLPPAARAAGVDETDPVGVADRVELVDLLIRFDVPAPAVRAKRPASNPQE